MPTQTPQNGELRHDFFDHFRGRDRENAGDGKYISLMELWKWIDPKLSQAYQRGRDEREQEIAKDMLSAIERQGRTLGTLSGFEFWATDVSNKAKK